jgi:casein kinase II subunit beta
LQNISSFSIHFLSLNSEALEMILSPDCPDDVDLEDENFMDTYQEASDLYGLIHARFIISPRGL